MLSLPPGQYFHLDKVIHQTWIEVNEEGTEATAATAVAMLLAFGIGNSPKPLVVRVDRPFLFAIQHVESGMCLFMGAVSNPG
jgi:serine protease inhibitor